MYVISCPLFLRSLWSYKRVSERLSTVDTLRLSQHSKLEKLLDMSCYLFIIKILKDP